MRSQIKRYYGVLQNVIYKIAGTVLTTGVKQALILPIFARIFSDSMYGTILTINGLMVILESTLGNTLNNTRIIMQQEYSKAEKPGDFNLLLLIASCAGIAGSVVIGQIFHITDPLISLTLMAAIATSIMNAYYIVFFMLRLEFKKTLFHSALMTAGSLIGLYITYITSVWPLVFLTGNLMALLYLYAATPLMREPYRRTPLFKRTAANWGLLVLVSFLGNLLLYIDRLLLYPLMGADMVAVFATAAFLGKTANTLFIPIANVFLGYITQENFKMTFRKFMLSAVFSVALGGVAIACCVLFAPLMKLIFPTLIERATPFLTLANAAVLVGSMSLLTQAAVLKFCGTTWLLIVQILYGAVYIVLGLVMAQRHGLMGFCYAVMIANAVKLVLFWVVGALAFGPRANLKRINLKMGI
jgi:O-antigen/teichoic acid export membrane protein